MNAPTKQADDIRRNIFDQIIKIRSVKDSLNDIQLDLDRLIKNQVSECNLCKQNSPTQNSDWHKDFVERVKVDCGVSHETTMQILGIACDYTQTSYIQGFNTGFNRGHKEGLEKSSDYNRGYKRCYADYSKNPDLAEKTVKEMDFSN